jgi:hypothetical protein
MHYIVLHTSGVAGLAANTTSLCGTSLSTPFTDILIITHIIKLMYSSHINQLACFSLFASHLAHLLSHYLFEFNLKPLSFTQQLVLMHLLMKQQPKSFLSDQQ